jgi:hypothetical protein
MESQIEVQAKEVNNTGFIPTIEISLDKLPSKGRYYPMGSKISLRSYSFGEVKRISDSTLSLLDKLQTVVSGINTTFDKNLLTLSDITYLGVIRRLNTLGTMKFKYPYTCPKCGTENEKHFTQEDLIINDIEAPELPIRATLSDGKEYMFGPITLKDMRLIDSGELDKYIPSKNVFKDKVALYSLLVKNFDFKDVYSFFTATISEEDHEIIDEVDRLVSHDIAPLQSVCSECKTEVRLPMKNAVDMVLPFRSEERSIRHRIHFGKGTVLGRD